MFVRGIDEPIEYKRDDNSFYRGIVVKNNDPMNLYRVKVYIPEISNQPLDDWLAQYKNFEIRFPGKNNKKDAWSDVKMFEHIAEYIPWAEPCFPIMGESGPARFNSPNEVATVSDTNYGDMFEVNNALPPSEESGAVSPSWWYETQNGAPGDAFCDPIPNLTTNNNPYAYMGRPSNHVNESKGVFGVPSVGSKVWVFHYGGDINFPVYFGVRHDFREISLITNMDQQDSKIHSLDYPGMFENSKNSNT